MIIRCKLKLLRHTECHFSTLRVEVCNTHCCFPVVHVLSVLWRFFKAKIVTVDNTVVHCIYRRIGNAIVYTLQRDSDIQWFVKRAIVYHHCNRCRSCRHLNWRRQERDGFATKVWRRERGRRDACFCLTGGRPRRGGHCSHCSGGAGRRVGR